MNNSSEYKTRWERKYKDWEDKNNDMAKYMDNSSPNKIVKELKLISLSLIIGAILAFIASAFSLINETLYYPSGKIITRNYTDPNKIVTLFIFPYLLLVICRISHKIYCETIGRHNNECKDTDKSVHKIYIGKYNNSDKEIKHDLSYQEKKTGGENLPKPVNKTNNLSSEAIKVNPIGWNNVSTYMEYSLNGEKPTNYVGKKRTYFFRGAKDDPRHAANVKAMSRSELNETPEERKSTFKKQGNSQ